MFKKSIVPRVEQRILYRTRRVPQLNPDLWSIFRNSWFNTIAMTRYALNQRSLFIDIIKTQSVESLFLDTQSHVVFGIHSGAFELMHLCLANPHKPVYVITEVVHNKIVNHCVGQLRSREKRSRENLVHLTPEQFVQSYKTIISTPSIVALVIDQGRGEPSGSVCIEQLDVPYFGKLIYRLHNKGFVPHAIRTVPQTVNRHSIFLDTYTGAAGDVLVNYVEESIVKTIVRNPHQWIWHYPRFVEQE